jgi:hypothetical protein
MTPPGTSGRFGVKGLESRHRELPVDSTYATEREAIEAERDAALRPACGVPPSSNGAASGSPTTPGPRRQPSAPTGTPPNKYAMTGEADARRCRPTARSTPGGPVGP